MHNLVLFGLLAILAPLFLFSPPPLMAQEVSIDASPLEACPDTPNCVHEAITYDLLPSALAPQVMQALKSKQLESSSQGTVNTNRIEAVFTAWSYKDDVHIAIEPHGSGSVLFIRSASREGHWDLGVNQRRVKRILRDLDALID